MLKNKNTETRKSTNLTASPLRLETETLRSLDDSDLARVIGGPGRGTTMR